jgi:cytochrome c
MPTRRARRQPVARIAERRIIVTSAIRRTARAQSITIAWRVGLAALAFGTALHVQSAFAAGDPAHGEQVYKTCKICHSLEKNGVGPKHAGVFGRTAGAVPDYRYSVALQKSGIVWTDATLDKWLADPQALVPGTKMFFAVDSAQDRADVIEFLKQKGGTATP